MSRKQPNTGTNSAATRKTGGLPRTLEQFAHGSVSGVLYTDKHGVTLYANQTACDIFGKSPDSFIGKNIRALISPEFAPLVDHYIDSAAGLRNQQPNEMFLQGFKSDGRPVDLKVSVFPVGNRPAGGICWSVLDITLQREFMEYARLERKLNDLLGRMGNQLVITLDSSGRITGFGGAAPEVAGIAPNLAIGQKFASRFISPADRAKIGKFLLGKKPADSSAVSQITAGFLTASGGERRIEWARVSAGPAKGTLLLGRDTAETGRQNRRLNEYRARLESAMRAIETARLDERRKISRDIHDDFGQLLHSIGLYLGALKKSVTKKPQPRPAEISREIERVEDIVDRVTDQFHALAVTLRTGSTADAGLKSALEGLCAVAAHAGSNTRLNYGISDEPPVETALALYRIAQEAMNNAIKHARPESIRISLERAGKGFLRLEVRDNGAGFQPHGHNIEFHPAGRPRLGLVGMRERAELAGGKLAVITGPGGTTVTAKLPIRP